MMTGSITIAIMMNQVELFHEIQKVRMATEKINKFSKSDCSKRRTYER